MSDREVDLALVQRVQAGDRAAFGLLVAKYERRILRLVSRFIRDSGEIEDVAQEAFVRAWRALATFRGESAFYTWLYRIAINTAKNHLEAQRRRPSTPAASEDDADSSVELSVEPATPETLMMSRQVGETVQKAIERLPEDLRRALVLREFEGLSYEEIAEIMDCPVGTVRSRIFRARDAVAEDLKPLIDRRSGRRW